MAKIKNSSKRVEETIIKRRWSTEVSRKHWQEKRRDGNN